MGLYDEIKFEYPLPDEFSHFQEGFFQTKDLDCLMSNFTIGKDGILYYHHVHYRDLTEKEKEEYKDKTFAPIMKATGQVDIVPCEDFHGDLLVYNEEIELHVRFTHGRLEYIKEWEYPSRLNIPSDF